MLRLSDQELHAKMIRLRRNERVVMIDLLDNLQEVFDRRLFADYGHSSLVKYLVRELGYSESAAFRRYQTLKLTREVPKARKLLESGELNITSASMIQGGLKNTNDRKKVVEESINKTTSETHDLILKINPDIKKRDIINPINCEETRVHITLSRDTLKKLNQFKAFSKKYKTDEALNLALSTALAQMELKEKRINETKQVALSTVPSSTAKKLRQRAKNKCEFEGCDEIYNLEIEHVKPKAKGGGNQLENLKLYCKSHNQRSAIKEFGMDIMNNYIN